MRCCESTRAIAFAKRLGTSWTAHARDVISTQPHDSDEADNDWRSTGLEANTTRCVDRCCENAGTGLDQRARMLGNQDRANWNAVDLVVHRHLRRAMQPDGRDSRRSGVRAVPMWRRQGTIVSSRKIAAAAMTSGMRVLRTSGSAGWARRRSAIRRRSFRCSWQNVGAWSPFQKLLIRSRRELILRRASRTASSRLDQLIEQLGSLQLHTDLAPLQCDGQPRLLAEARKRGKPTAEIRVSTPTSILAAQAHDFGPVLTDSLTVATYNDNTPVPLPRGCATGTRSLHDRDYDSRERNCIPSPHCPATNHRRVNADISLVVLHGRAKHVGVFGKRRPGRVWS